MLISFFQPEMGINLQSLFSGQLNRFLARLKSKRLIEGLGSLGILIPIILLASCSDRQATINEGMVLPISDILISKPEFTEIGPESATLQVFTKIPVVCAVVYGMTSEYGQLATDADMAGGAHPNHYPVLTGLEPDTLYYARLQGVGSDGALYQSEEFTFHTPLPEATKDQINLALLENGAYIVGVSSNYGDAPNNSVWGAVSAIDGDGSTAWSSNGDGDDAWVEIGLATRTHITRIGFWTRSMGSSAEINSFQIIIDTGEIIGPFILGDSTKIHYFETDIFAESLRFEAVTTSGGNTGAVEIEIYGSPQ
jgi:hypothetical protein